MLLNKNNGSCRINYVICHLMSMSHVNVNIVSCQCHLKPVELYNVGRGGKEIMRALFLYICPPQSEGRGTCSPGRDRLGCKEVWVGKLIQEAQELDIDNDNQSDFPSSQLNSSLDCNLAISFICDSGKISQARINYLV